TTFGTLMSKGGVPLRTAQAAMRHSDPKLTANVYTDPKLQDVRGALDVLPALPLEDRREAGQATGTGGPADTSLLALARALAPTPDNSGTPGSTAGKRGEGPGTMAGQGGAIAGVGPGKSKAPVTTAVITGACQYPQGDSNPCLLAENQTT